jgi:hypothetical protein
MILAAEARVVDTAHEPARDTAAGTQDVPSPGRNRALLYDPARRGFKRSTVEEGIRGELDVMNGEACGTPFFGATTPEPPAPTQPARTSMASLDQRLAALGRRR